MRDEFRQVKDSVVSMEARFDAAIARLTDCIDRQHNNSNSQSTITLNAGGVGVWIAATACAVMLAVNILLIVILVNHDRKIDDLSHYLNAIYMVAPQLRPEE